MLQRLRMPWAIVINFDMNADRESGTLRSDFVLMVGRPGSGKGMQSTLLAQSLNIAHVCTGDLLRTSRDPKLRAIAESGTNLSTDLAVSLVFDRLRHSDCRNGAVLDGCARNIAQATALHEALGKSNRHLRAVVVLEISEEEARQRIIKRGLAEGRQRGDDDPQVITKRLANYIHETTAAIEYFEAVGLVERVNASRSAEAIQEEVLSRLASRP
jgi:adenylate kinase